MRLLARLLTSFMKVGTLSLIDAHGRSHVFGGRTPTPAVAVRLHDAGLHTRLALNPELYAAEAYMDGTLTLEDGSAIYDLLLLFSVNRKSLGAVRSQQVLRRFWRMTKRFTQSNSPASAARNARSHYDVPVEIYRLFLDEGLNYSCAFFHDPDRDTLEAAQLAKLTRATNKLGLKPGMTVAEIGSGWGAFAVHIAETTGAHVVGINVSPEQLKISRALAAARGVTDLVEFREMDYRALEGKFDRVVSVGMMEHVGAGFFDAYFEKISSLLKEDGYAYVHCIGRTLPPGTTSHRLFANTSSRAPTCRHCRRCSPPRSVPPSGSPTWKCSGCIIITPSGTGAPASPPGVQKRWRSPTNGSAGCGNSTSRPSNWIS